MADSMIAIMLLSFCFFTLLLGLILLLLTHRKRQIDVRLNKYLVQKRRQAAVKEEPQGEKPSIILGMSKIIGKKFFRPGKAKGWGAELQQAGMKIPVEQFFGLRVLASMGTVLIASVLGYGGWFFAPAILAGFWLPVFYVKWKKKKRLNRCMTQLPPTLGTMANALRSGFSFMQTMQLVAKDIPDPLGPEFQRVLEEIGLGLTIEEAFERLLQRMPNRDLEVVITALLIQRSTGGNLAQLLETMQETITGRVRIKEELNALTAQGRISGYIITLLPIILLILINMMNPGYAAPLFSHMLGFIMLGVSAVMITLGWLVIRKIVSIEV
jgi:tight adherence protein B